MRLWILPATLAAVALISVPNTAGADELDRSTLQALAQRCGEEIPWTQTWDEASRQSRDTGRPILVAVRSLPGFALLDGSMVGPFMDPDIIRLVRTSFVPFRFTKGMDAPFVSQDSYGMGPSTFGTSILVADTQGRIIGDTFTLETTSLHEFLCERLDAFGRPEAPEFDDDEDLAEWHLVRGAPRQTLTILEEPQTPRAYALHSRALLCLRQAEPALEAIDKALALDPEPPLRTHIDRIALLLTLDRIEAATTSATELTEHYPDDPELAFVHGALALARGENDTADKTWTSLVQNNPESRWSWLAAAQMHVGIHRSPQPRSFAWPEENIHSLLRRKPLEPLAPNQIEEAIETSLDYLLQNQRPDGSWIVAGEVLGKQDNRLNPLVVATTALCARALLPFLDDDRAEQAISKALAFIKDSRATVAEKGRPFSIMDYTVWSRPSVILFLVDAIDSGIAEASQWQPVIEEIAQALQSVQKAGGGWNYYQGTDPLKLDPNLDISFSFVTAYVLIALEAAGSAGISIPQTVSDKGLSCLERMRNDDGTFEYSIIHANEDAPRTPSPSGSAGRGPLCTLALHKWGRASEAQIQASLEHFMKHRDAYSKEQGKTLMHCGTEGEGSHYLMFDYAFAVAAYTLLQEEKKTPFHLPLCDQILQARSEEGSYVDNPMIGDHYGTGMALWSLCRLADDA